MDTPISTFTKFAQTNLTTTSYPTLSPTTTKPSGNGVLSLAAISPTNLREITSRPPATDCISLVFFGVGATGAYFNARIVGWSRVGSLWLPLPLASFLCTLGSSTGIAGQAVTNSEKLASTISVESGNSITPASVIIHSPASPGIASVLIDAEGCELLQLIGVKGSTTSFNALVRAV